MASGDRDSGGLGCERRSVSYDASQTGTGLVPSEVGQLFVKTSLRWESERLMWARLKSRCPFLQVGVGLCRIIRLFL